MQGNGKSHKSFMLRKANSRVKIPVRMQRVNFAFDCESDEVYQAMVWSSDSEGPG